MKKYAKELVPGDVYIEDFIGYLRVVLFTEFFNSERRCRVTFLSDNGQLYILNYSSLHVLSTL